jgi:hypothetical protein
MLLANKLRMYRAELMNSRSDLVPIDYLFFLLFFLLLFYSFPLPFLN